MNKYANTYLNNLKDLLGHLGQASKKHTPDFFRSDTFEQGEGNPVSAGSPPSRRSHVGRLRGVSGGHTVTSDLDKAQGFEGFLSMNAGAPSRFSREVGAKGTVVPLSWYPSNSNVNFRPTGTLHNDPAKNFKSMLGAMLPASDKNFPKTFPTSGSISAKVIGPK